MLWELLDAARDLGRLQDIASILIRYGFADAVRRMGMATALEKVGHKLRWQHAEELAHMAPARRVRRIMEELGPTYIKLGQMLSTRVDIFPQEWIEEFEMLQDQVPAVGFDAIREQLTEDLGTPPEAVFRELNPEPLASASIAQVYRARLADETPVIVKVRRPGIRAIVEADLRMLARLAEVGQSQVPQLSDYQLQDLVREFRDSIMRELDLANECYNAERITERVGHRYQGEENPLLVPKVYWEWTGTRHNVQEFIAGIPGRDVTGVRRAGLDCHRLAVNCTQVMLSMILEDGLFHADPHPGNLFFLPGGRFALVDFGMVGHLSETRREQLTMLLHGIVKHDEEAVAEILAEWSSEGTPDRDRLEHSVGGFLRTYHGVALEHLDMGAMLRDLLAILRDHGLALPWDLSAALKVFIFLEGLGRRLNPEFNLVVEVEPVVRRAFMARFSPAALARRGQRNMMDLMRLLSGLPRELRDTLKATARGALQLQINVKHLEELADRLDRAASRITVGLVTAALIVGTSIAMTADKGPTLFGLPLFGTLSFFAAGVGGLWVLISILRGK